MMENFGEWIRWYSIWVCVRTWNERSVPEDWAAVAIAPWH